MSDDGKEIERLREVIRVNGLRWGHSHAEIDAILWDTPPGRFAEKGALDGLQPYNDSHTHEALHAASIIIDMLDRHLIDTRCAEQFPEVRRLMVTIAEQMGDLYQMIGTKFEERSE